MPYIDATGVKLYFEEAGEGHPIIFLHELGSDSRGWETQIRYFSRAYRCITFNARGYAPSDVPNDPTLFGWELAVNDIAAVMRGLAIEHAHLVGLSMGGYAALQFGLRYPEKTSGWCGSRIGSFPARRLVERDLHSRAGFHRARDGRDGPKNGAWPDAYPT
jgi:pimeloyl-ACP methyl ester carboxylesterase